MSTKAQISAWNEITQNHAENLEGAIMILMDQSPTRGLTKDDLIRELKVRHQTITSRMSILQDKGKIIHNNQSRGSCTVFFSAPPALWNVYASNRKLKKYKDFLRRGVNEFGMKPETTAELLKEFFENNKLTPEFAQVSIKPESKENILFEPSNVYDHFHQVSALSNRRILTATLNIDNEMIQKIKGEEIIRLNGRTYKVPELLKNGYIKAGTHKLDFEEINQTFN